MDETANLPATASGQEVALTKAGKPMLPWARTTEVAEQIVERYMDGEHIQDVADGYGVTQWSIYKLLVEKAEEAWKAAQVSKSIYDLERAKQGLEEVEYCEASEGKRSYFQITRARESARIAMWSLERTYSRAYGVRQDTAADGRSMIQINIDMSAAPAGGVISNATVIQED